MSVPRAVITTGLPRLEQHRRHAVRVDVVRIDQVEAEASFRIFAKHSSVLHT